MSATPDTYTAFAAWVTSTKPWWVTDLRRYEGERYRHEETWKAFEAFAAGRGSLAAPAAPAHAEPQPVNAQMLRALKEIDEDLAVEGFDREGAYRAPVRAAIAAAEAAKGNAVAMAAMPGQLVQIGEVGAEDLAVLEGKPAIGLKTSDGRDLLLIGLTRDECTACAGAFNADVTIAVFGGVRAAQPEPAAVPLAEVLTLFAKMEVGRHAENLAEHAIEKILGVELLGIAFDTYDSSFEIYPLADVAITPEMHAAILALGCQRYWVNFEDGTESYCGGERKATGRNNWQLFNAGEAAARRALATPQPAPAGVVEALRNARDLIATDRQAFVDGNAIHTLTTNLDPDDLVIYADGVWLTKDAAECVHDYDRGLAQIDAALAAADAALSAPVQAVPLTAEQIDSLSGLDTSRRVRFYEHDFYVLSNFSAFNLWWRGIVFATSEHAYHWEKFAGRPDARNSEGSIARQVANAASAHEAFKIAEAHRELRRPDWDDVKVDIMRDILRAKADQHEYVQRKLLATGDRELVEDSWRDDFWGWGPNRDGQNMLGKLWMEVRSELRAHGITGDKHG